MPIDKDRGFVEVCRDGWTVTVACDLIAPYKTDKTMTYIYDNV